MTERVPKCAIWLVVCDLASASKVEAGLTRELTDYCLFGGCEKYVLKNGQLLDPDDYILSNDLME